MGVVAVICVEEMHIFNLLRTNLKRQGWVVFRAETAEQALEHVRKEGASFLIVDTRGIVPMTHEQLAKEIYRDPGDDFVRLINLDIRSPQPPSIFGNPKGPLPPAVAVRPLDWIDQSARHHHKGR